MEKTCLNLGCGNDYREGWINIDNQSQFQGKIDKKADFMTLKWKNNSVDEILANHIAMYITLEEMPKILKRWYGWLKKGGELTLETGNLYSICKQIIQAKTLGDLNGRDGVGQLFGLENTAGHKWCYTPETMIHLLKETGFKKIEVFPGFFHNNPARDFLIIANK